MPFFIRQYADRVTYRVHLVEAPTKLEAEQVPLDENTNLGYFDDDAPRDRRCYGPFETKEEAEASDFAWVQDV